MSGVVDDLWAVAAMTPHVDASALASAVQAAVTGEAIDYRTRLLVRDSLRALEAHWGHERFEKWLHESLQRREIQEACNPASFDSDPAEVGFPSLSGRVVDAIQPETVFRFLRELSTHVSRPTQIMIGGSVALIVAGHLTRRTDDIDVVDEVPAELRKQHALLDELEERYKLRLTHFQSHYLPLRWEQRVQSIGNFGHLQAFAIDPYDIFVGKLFSVRKKDRDDLNALTPRLDRAKLLTRVRETTAPLRSDAKLLDAAKQNWFILFGEQLPE